MLTHRSSKASRTKMLVFIPLVVLSFVLFSKDTFSKEKYRPNQLKTVTRNGSKFVIRKSEFRGMINRTDPETGAKYADSVFNDAIPLKIDGRTIYGYHDTTIILPQYTGHEKTVWSALLSNISQTLGSLPDGKYFAGISSPVVDESGRLVYYEFDCVVEITDKGRVKARHYEFGDAIRHELDLLYTNVKIKPASLKGKAVPYFWMEIEGRRFEVKNHVVTIE